MVLKKGTNRVLNNKSKFYVYSVFENLLILLTNGAIIQTFLLEKNFSGEMVGNFLAILTLAQAFFILSFSKKSDNIKNIISTMAYIRFLEIPLCILLVFMCFMSTSNVFLMYILLIAVGLLYSVSKGVNSVLSYKLPYSIIDINEYGAVSSISGVLVGIFCTIFSILLSYMQVKFEYMSIMKIAYIMAFPMVFITIISIKTMKNINGKLFENTRPTVNNEKEKKYNILKYKPFKALIIPNLLRGFNSGIIGMAVTIGYFIGSIDSKSAGIIVIVTNIMTILGCLIYFKINNKLEDKVIILISSIVIACSLPLMIVFNTALFIVFYSILYLFYSVINYAVPVIVTKIVDYHIVGQYSAGRMLLHTLGTAIAGFVCVGMMNLFGAVWTLILSGATQLISAIVYYIYLSDRKNITKCDIWRLAT